jgi:hypothetical protein
MTDTTTSLETNIHEATEPLVKRKPMLCQQCHLQPFKYRCPRCDCHTCSLACSQQHKKDTGCNGQRDRTKYVSMKQFDVNQLASGK